MRNCETYDEIPLTICNIFRQNTEFDQVFMKKTVPRLLCPFEAVKIKKMSYYRLD